MNEKLEAKFQEIVDEAIEEASLIDCPLEDFLEGLKTMKSAIDERVSQVERVTNAAPCGITKGKKCKTKSDDPPKK